MIQKLRRAGLFPALPFPRPSLATKRRRECTMKWNHLGRLLLVAVGLLGSCGLAWLLLPDAGAAKLLLFAALVLFLTEFLYRLDRRLAKKTE